jgi:hypothetical protein
MGEVVFDAFVSDPIQIDIDPAVYALWLRGTSGNRIFFAPRIILSHHFLSLLFCDDSNGCI